MQILMQRQMMQQAEQEKRLKYVQEQQHGSHHQKEHELQQQNLQKIMSFKKTPNKSQPDTSQDVFHFPQSSSLSTSGQELPPYSVDKDFIKDLEKSLGASEAVANMLGYQMYRAETKLDFQPTVHPQPTLAISLSNLNKSTSSK